MACRWSLCNLLLFSQALSAILWLTITTLSKEEGKEHRLSGLLSSPANSSLLGFEANNPECRLHPSCTPPFLNFVFVHRGRGDNLARAIKSVRRAATPEEHRCICVIVMDFEVLTQEQVFSKDPATIQKVKFFRILSSTSILNIIHSNWAGPHFIKTFTEPFNKVMGLQAGAEVPRTPSAQTIIFSMDVDMIIKPGTLPGGHQIQKILLTSSRL